MTLGWRVSTRGGTPLAYSELQERVRGAWRTILKRTTRTSCSFVGSPGHTYRFRVRAVNQAGQAGRWRRRAEQASHLISTHTRRDFLKRTR